MPGQSPLRKTHAQAEASFQTWGPEESGVEVVETFGEIAAEYAALRRGCALFDMSNRAVLEVTGDDRIDFLGRMLTQNIAALAPYRAARSFWLNRKGRIDADFRVLVLEDRVLLECDVLAAERARSTLDAFVITEDVRVEWNPDAWACLALHGPTTPDLLRAVCVHDAGVPLNDFAEGSAARVRLADAEVWIDRQDECGEYGAHLWLKRDGAERVWTRLVEAGCPSDDENGTAQHAIRMRAAGWHAYNIARIEAGTPLYNIDFGEQSLPAETGVLRDRVNFKKGCYLGQEVVARMDALGKPKQVLAALRFEHAPDGTVVQPMPGAHVLLDTGDAADAVGAVTSSTISPMLGGEAVAFAQVRTKHAENPDARLIVAAEGHRVRATVQPSLRFWERGG
ncbi:MAG: CAF17-like 4Fe-4S cluster assembly/insertion protein YgfZ [Phycisphaerales bacterium]